ncbi:hypothetical protein TNCV_738461 [Trichonephila clavipes]|nr:hypothetical protein TNCV_738461 [Trichonephila clavipes]
MTKSFETQRILRASASLKDGSLVAPGREPSNRQCPSRVEEQNHSAKIRGINETPATNTERAGRRSDPETSWRRSGTYEGRTRKESIAKRDHGGGVTVRTDPVSICSRAFGVVDELWFQQDGATCHTARATIDLLKDTFGDRLISRFGPVNWPPRSCDLTPLDYFLWGYVKSVVYADKPQTLDHLEDNIRRIIADIRPQMLEKVIENWTSRLDYIRASHGSPMPEIIFKM